MSNLLINLAVVFAKINMLLSIVVVSGGVLVSGIDEATQLRFGIEPKNEPLILFVNILSIVFTKNTTGSYQ